MNTKEKLIGTFDIKSKKILIGDPCRNKNSSLLIEIPILKGAWNATLVEKLETNIITRKKEYVKHAIILNHQEYPLYSLTKKGKMELLGRIPVDSGLVAGCSSTSWNNNKTIPKDFFKNQTLITDAYDWYEMICQVERNKTYIIPNGCVISTAYGDGLYTVKASYNNKMSVYTAIKIDLI